MKVVYIVARLLQRSYLLSKPSSNDSDDFGHLTLLDELTYLFDTIIPQQQETRDSIVKENVLEITEEQFKSLMMEDKTSLAEVESDDDIEEEDNLFDDIDDNFAITYP